MHSAAKSPDELTARIVCAYVAHNTTPAAAVPELVRSVLAALTQTAAAVLLPAPERPLPSSAAAKRQPMVAVEASVQPDFLVCLEDGLRFKSLRRHLRTQYGLSPAQYRKRWHLPADYPMVAPNYAAERARMAKSWGFGRKKRAPSQPDAAMNGHSQG